jgi:hypothetical protein
MLHNDPPPSKRRWASDDEARMLLHRGARHGPWERARFFVAAVLSGLILAGAAWWFWPRKEPPILLVVAFDRVTPPNRPTIVRAATEPLNATNNGPWGGSEIFFEEAGNQAAGVSGKTRKAKTDQNGLAEIEWQFPATSRPVGMEVRYIDESQHPPWSYHDQARIFVWPEDSRILVLEVEPRLKNPANWPTVAEALTAAADRGWHIVYLGVGPDRPTVYQKLRAYAMQLTTADRGKGPEGPVLARKDFLPRPAKSGPGDVHEVLADLRRDFRGPVVYLDADKHIQLSQVAEDGQFIGTVTVPDWESLVDSLPQ